jgi:2-iminobutanoate/2-iminopropanoate deaminase
MRSIIICLFSLLLLTSCAQHTPTNIQRYTINSWETEIGYTAVVQSGNTHYISGVTCGGQNYESAVTVCYQELGKILASRKLSPQNIVKENIYALDIEALKEQISVRKKFYSNNQFPAATWVQVSRLYSPNHLIEIELVAVK